MGARDSYQIGNVAVRTSPSGDLVEGSFLAALQLGAVAGLPLRFGAQAPAVSRLFGPRTLALLRTVCREAVSWWISRIRGASVLITREPASAPA